MRTILRAQVEAATPRGVAFNFDDMTEKAKAYLAGVQSEARKIVEAAEKQAQQIRSKAQEEGQAAAMAQMERAAEQKIAAQVKSLLPALKAAVQQVEQSRAAWLKHWERQAVHLAAAIAERVIRKELSRDPEITLTLVREALELAAGSADIRIYLNPDDHRALGAASRLLIDELNRAGNAEVVTSSEVSSGGCRVETRFGAIDQQIETQLARIEEELA